MSAIRRVSNLGTQGTSSIVDGSIQTADIANGAITSAKLDTNISISGTLTASSVNSAKTVYETYSAVGGKVTMNTTTWTDLVSLTAYAPTANTVFIVTFHTDHNADETGAWKRVGIFFNGNLDRYVITSVTTAAFQDAMGLTARLVAGSVGNHTIAVKAQNGAGQSTFAEENTNGHKSVLVVQAVQY